MYDRFKRKITYLRISVTDRCNLRCTYCMPEEGIHLLEHKDILSYEEIIQVVKVAVNLGVNKIRITGGEPLVRKGITDLISGISQITGIRDISMTTNGILLDDFAEKLASARLNRVNISLDTIDPFKYKEITRGGDIEKVFAGIHAARKAGLDPIKINCVVMQSSSEKDAIEVKKFGMENGLEVRFIHQMNLMTGEFSIVEGGSGGDCERCNRLRLTANGLVKPCLFSNMGYNVRKMGIKEALLKAVNHKPESGTLNCSNQFYNIGG
ncbi:GTP 3',8-cyclase MoaA [candidate division KSB1 bacterium]